MTQPLNAWLEDLRHATHDIPSPPTLQHWHLLCARLEQAPSPEAARLGADYLRAHLATWPSNLLTAPWTWSNALHKGDAHPALALCAAAYTPDALSARGLLTFLDRLHAHASNLHRLTLNLPRDLSSSLAARLAAHPILIQLRELNLQLSANTTPGALNALLASGCWPNLERLTLHSHYQNSRPLSTHYLSHNQHCTNLRTLALHGTRGHDIDLTGAFDAHNTPTLDTLALYRGTSAPLDALYASPLLGQLQALSILGNTLPEDALAPLRAWPDPLPLRSLTVSPRDALGVAPRLLLAPSLRRLEALALTYTPGDANALHSELLGLAHVPLRRRLLLFSNPNVILTRLSMPPDASSQALTHALTRADNPGERLGAAYLLSAWFQHPGTRPADFPPALGDPAPLMEALDWPGLDPDDSAWEYAATASGYTQNRAQHRVHAAAAHALAMCADRHPDTFPQLAARFRRERNIQTLQALCHALIHNAPDDRAALDLFMHSTAANAQAFDLALTALAQRDAPGARGDLLALLRRGLRSDAHAACDLLRALQPAPDEVLDDLRAAWTLHRSAERATRTRRRALVHAIGALDWSAHLPELADLMLRDAPHPCVNVSLWSARVLAAQLRHQPNADPAPLLRLVTDHAHPQVRLNALGGLLHAHLHQPGVHDAIHALIDTPPARWTDLGAAALYTLARARVAAPALCCALAERAVSPPDASNASQHADRQNAALKLLCTQRDALSDAEHARARAVARRLLASPQLHVRKRAHTLVGFRPGATPPTLAPEAHARHLRDALSALDDPNKGIRARALQRLDRLLHGAPPARMVEALRPRLDHADARVRKRARRLLRRLGETVATPTP